MERRLAAIMAADMVGYSRLMSADETGTVVRQKALRKSLIDPEIAAHEGRIVKTTGDGFLAEFASVVNAVECARDIQNVVTKRERQEPEERRISYRIGINLGDIIVDEGDVFGDGVNIAARLEQIADAGGVCVSEAVYQNVKARPDVQFERLGKKAVKNIPGEIQVYRLRRDAATPSSPTIPFVGRLVLPDKPSIAVLPFSNMSSDKEQEHFADGVTEDLIAALSRIRELFVISRSSSFVYKGRSVRIQDIARELGVRFVLEGSVRLSGRRVRVTAQLIDGMSGDHVWAERFDATLDNIFDVQDEITRSIALAMQVKLTIGESARLWDGQTKNLRAWEKMVLGRDLFLRWDFASNRRAQEALREALALDPSYTGAMAQLGLSYWWDARANTAIDKQHCLRLADEQVERILKLDSEIPVGYTLRGALAFVRDSHDEAVGLAQRAVDLSPSDSFAIAFLGQFCIFAGQSERAIAAFQSAMRLSPYYPAWYTYNLAMAYLWLPDLLQAEEAASAYIAKEDEPYAYLCLATVFGFQERFDEAREVLAEGRKRHPSFGKADIVRSQRYKDPSKLARVLDVLRQAGLPD